MEEQCCTINWQHSLLSLVTVNSRKGERKKTIKQLHLKIKPTYSIVQPFPCAMCVCVRLHFFHAVEIYDLSVLACLFHCKTVAGGVKAVSADPLII